MRSWIEFLKMVFELSLVLEHQWAVALRHSECQTPDENIKMLLEEQPPQTDDELTRRLERLEDWVCENSRPGAAGWGITFPGLRVLPDGVITWRHESYGKRYYLSADFNPVKDEYRLTIEVRRPYPWQPVVFQLHQIRLPGGVSTYCCWYPPVGARHFDAATKIVRALSIDVPEVEALDNESMADSDASALKEWYAGTFVPPEPIISQVR